MVVIDIFAVRWMRGTGEPPPHLIEVLRQRMDEIAPAPWRGVCPDGGPVIIFAVDFHRSPAAVCAWMGFEYIHVCFSELVDEEYTPLNELVFRRHRWARVFFLLWSREVAVTSL